MLKVKDLNISYNKTNVLKNISLHLKKKQKVVILGESGSGKSTFLYAITKLLSLKNGVIDNGAITFGNKNINKMNFIEYSKYVAYIPQDPKSYFDPLFSIKYMIDETIQKKERSHIYDLFSLLELPSYIFEEKIYPHQLSGGMLQRILILTAIAQNTAIIVADEPTSNLDINMENKVIELFNTTVNANSTGFILSTHNINLAKQFADYIYVFYNGHILEHAHKDIIINSPKEKYTKDLFNKK